MDRGAPFPAGAVEAVVDLSSRLGQADLDILGEDGAAASVVPHVLADRLDEVGVATCSPYGGQQAILVPLDAALGRRDGEGVTSGVVVEQADRAVVVETFGVAGRVGELRSGPVAGYQV